MKSLVLAEKPSVGREIARVLGCRDNRRNYFEGPKYVVTWALGHLVTLAEPEDYDNKYREWKIEDLPIMPGKMKLKRLPETTRQFRTIEQLAKRTDLKELIIATDAGREGELVARWIMQMIRWSKPFRRLWISSQTDKAIRDGFANLRPGREYDRLFDSAVSRAEADWLIGLNISRALTCKYNTPLSAGRVQTPTLAMLMEREKEIEQFRSKAYRLLELDLGPFRAVWRDRKGGDARIFDQERAERLAGKLKDGEARIVSIQTASRSEPQPLPYDLTELQRDANRRFGFSAKKTSTVLQSLYERHKIVTYPRTDSRYLTTDMLATMKERLSGMSVGPYEQWTRQVRDGQLQAKRVVNNSKVTDHHAIIPTEERLRLQDLDNDERRLYDMIACRFLALFFPSHRYEETKLTLEVHGETLAASGKAVTDPGWKRLYDRSDLAGAGGTDTSFAEANEADDDGSGANRQLPQGLAEGKTYPVRSVEVRTLHTQPPGRYTEAALLTMMEKHHLGTPATRADIIEKLLHANSIERKGQTLVLTPKGKQLLELVVDELQSPELTEKWERELEKIAAGKADMQKFLKNIRSMTRQIVAQVKSSNREYKPFNSSNSHCPECGQMLQQINRKRGTVLVCINEDCGYKRSLEKTIINRRCPQCRKKMELREGKAGKFVHCRPCNIVEQLDNTPGGKKEQKRETQKLMKKYQPSSLGNSLGDALREALEKKQ